MKMPFEFYFAMAIIIGSYFLLSDFGKNSQIFILATYPIISIISFAHLIKLIKKDYAEYCKWKYSL